MPTASDLVTDLPADFEVFGQAVDTRLKALQPGTTLGDIAYSSATANTSTRLPIGTTGQVLAVSGGVPTWTTTADVTPLTTKGDLFTFTTVDARLAVGNNGETLVADSSASTGLRYQTGVNRNITVNGGADIWQRGTSISTGAAFVYTADRWRAGRGGFAAGTTISRQATGDTTNLPNIQYCIRWQRDSGNTSTADMRLGINFETIESIPFAGQTVVFSFYARKSSTWTDANSTFTISLVSGTGTDEGSLPSGSLTGQATVASSSALLTTTWQRFTATGTVSASATQLGFNADWLPVGTAGASDYMEITGLQLELGTVPTVFKRAGGTIQGELAACQRYFQQVINGDTQNIGVGWNYSSSYAMAILYLPVVMRTAPTIAVTSGTNYYTFERNGALDPVNAFFGAANTNPNNAITLRNSTEISGTAADAGLFFSNNASANISLSAEL